MPLPSGALKQSEAPRGQALPPLLQTRCKATGVEEFWSITRYSAITRNTLPGKNDVFNAYNTEPDGDGNITITFRVGDPDDGTYWMPVNAGEPYYFVVRYYKADLADLPPTHCELTDRPEVDGDPLGGSEI